MARLDPQSLPQHVDRLYRAAWVLCGSPHDAEDLVQETFARVLARPRHLHGQDELAYLMRVLRNTFLTQRRTASRRPQSAQVTPEEIDAADPRTGERPEQAVQAREVFGVIAALPDNYRLALVAVDIVGLSYREAAKALGTREATIATRVFRGRERVAQEMSGEPPPAPTPDSTRVAAVDATPRSAKATPRPTKATPRSAKATPRPAGATPSPTKATPRPTETIPRRAEAAPRPAGEDAPREASGPQGSLV